MRKRFTTVLMVLALLYALTLTAFAAGPNGTLSVQLYSWNQRTYTPASAEVVKLTLNGDPLSGDVPAMIQGGRTLVPVRLVGEALQAQVLWVQQTGQVILTKGEDVIVLTLDSATAIVNGVYTPLPDGVPAQVVAYDGADRTMIPLRFVSETLGAQVEWDQATYTAHLTAELTETVPETPEEEPETPSQEPEVPADAVQITGMSWSDGTLTIATDQAPNCKVTDLGDRVAIDFLDTVLSEDFTGCTASDTYLSDVRWAQHGANFYPGSDHTVRFVLDLAAGATVVGNLTITTTLTGVSVTTHGTSETAPTVSIIPQDYTIVIDPGHGGDRPGACYEGIMEKDIDLAVSLKLVSILQNQGFQVIMTRSTDVEIGLYERADLANAAGADVFVSLHSNAAENRPDYQGIYTYYHPSSNRGARLAQAIQTPLCQITGGIDRGIKDADFVVLRETDMCAVLVEMGFMTNHEELMNLTDDGYQQLLAQGIAQGIVDYLTAEAQANA
ncbi:N-acetylmuramoyl-L-alanine amidase [Intestinimonas timonensis]|uniref:N-acetylmuramoyl-L-alanine amidase n=1 Tax=Intestinimonas timonensis TaxID=1689270 RepID=UPI0024B09DFF|nr:N-acetylmuramoyl-L-alanine amidase [Intestinimonas timonensis]